MQNLILCWIRHQLLSLRKINFFKMLSLNSLHGNLFREWVYMKNWSLGSLLISNLLSLRKANNFFLKLNFRREDRRLSNRILLLWKIYLMSEIKGIELMEGWWVTKKLMGLGLKQNEVNDQLTDYYNYL